MSDICVKDVLEMNEDKVNKSISMPLSTKKEIDWLIDHKNPNRKFTNFSDAVNKLVSIGILLTKNEGKIKSEEFEQELQGIIKNETLWDWISSLSPSQRLAIRQAVDFVEEDTQRKLVY